MHNADDDDGKLLMRIQFIHKRKREKKNSIFDWFEIQTTAAYFAIGLIFFA